MATVDGERPTNGHREGAGTEIDRLVRRPVVDVRCEASNGRWARGEIVRRVHEHAQRHVVRRVVCQVGEWPEARPGERHHASGRVLPQRNHRLIGRGGGAYATEYLSDGGRLKAIDT